MAWSNGWPAPAKLNLFLHVVGQREDGYHLLQTVFQFIDLRDELSFEVTDNSDIELMTPTVGVAPSDDLVVRSAVALQQSARVKRGARIRLDKQIPMGGGLGGGSSDAATVLCALNSLWSVGLSATELARIGLELGADVPVFIQGQTAWAEGVGEHLTPVAMDTGYALLITPDCPVNTGLVFRDENLTRNTPAIKMHAVSLDRTHNDCEPVTRRLYPEVAEALDWLARFAPARMSGTGASVYAFFDEREQADGIAANAPDKWRVQTVSRLNRSPLLDRLAAQSRKQ